ncbi:HAMP domain-containing protein [Amycolatopsis sp. SID8362]|nr:HAMP domain-containing protein [Amycolatopsis sp. SID8362]NED47089.1 HAMP domain-containing protein [Amycolatopsis sp. SID8362]
MRTKITAVLLLPVIVALALAAGRIQPELSTAGALSGVRDQLPVAQGVVALTDLVDQEAVAAAGGAGSEQRAQSAAAVDAATGPLLRAANFAGLASRAQDGLSVTLGRLSGLRLRSSGVGDAVAATAGYKEVVFALAEIVPDVVAGAARPDLTAGANTIRSLLQMRADVVTQDAILRSAPVNRPSVSALVGADRAATEELLVSGQIQRTATDQVASRLANVTAATASRQEALENALATGHFDALPALLEPVAAEVDAINALLRELVGSLVATVSDATNEIRSSALRDTALVLGALLGALAVALFLARTLVSPVRRLHAAALNVAHRQLPETVARARAGVNLRWEDVPPVPVRTEEEIGQLARAFDEMHRQALRLAGEQAELRRQVSEMFMTLSRRSQALVELQLSVIEELEAEEQDPRRLDALFRIDHIATRLRRNGENLQVLAGGTPARRDHQPITIVELMRAATSEVKDYRRVTLGNAPGGSVRGDAAPDIVHILAELLDNATRHSPPEEKVVLNADRGADGGLLIEVVDGGLGMTVDDLEATNGRLAAGDAVNPETTRRMGLYVVGRLAAPHGVIVRLRRTSARSTRAGVTASVHLPGNLVLPDRFSADQEHVLTAPQVLPPRPRQAEPGTAVNGSVAGLLPVTTGRHELSPHHGGINGASSRAVSPAAPADRSSAALTPIFDRIVSSWFSPAEPGGESDPARRAEDWGTRTDDARRAAESAVEPVNAATVTPSGLPVREPGSQLAPGAAVPRSDTARPTAGFRDPAAVRNNLSQHYNGMRAARLRTRGSAGETDVRRPPGGSPGARHEENK